MLKDDFPQIWVPSWENRDLRQLLWHRHRMVQVRTRIMNQLQAVALNEGLRCKKKLRMQLDKRQGIGLDGESSRCWLRGTSANCQLRRSTDGWPEEMQAFR